MSEDSHNGVKFSRRQDCVANSSHNKRCMIKPKKSIEAPYLSNIFRYVRARTRYLIDNPSLALVPPLEFPNLCMSGVTL